MADMVFRFNIKVSPRAVRWGLGALLVCMMAGELGSESVTLSTYYPAPSGVYTRMITTGFTYLARDTDSVGVGTTNPGSKLHVNGQVIAGSASGAPPGSEGFSSVGGGAGFSMQDRSNAADRWVVYSNAAHFRIYNGSDFVRIDTSGQTSLGRNADDPRATVDVGRDWGGGDILIRKSCTTRAFSGAAECPGQYVTLAAGVYVSRWELGPVGTDSDYTSGAVLCCNCPTGGCVAGAF